VHDVAGAVDGGGRQRSTHCRCEGWVWGKPKGWSACQNGRFASAGSERVEQQLPGREGRALVLSLDPDDPIHPTPGDSSTADDNPPGRHDATCWSSYDGAVKFALDGIALRRTSHNESFPWLLRQVTLVRVTSDGTAEQAKTDGEKRALLATAGDDDLVLAAWPGEWSQDVFVVDDLRAARIELGLPRNGTTRPTPPIDTPAPPSPIDDDREPAPRLWQRLVGVARLPPEGQRQVAHQYDVAAALLRRPDLDADVRERVIADLPSWSAGSVVAAGALTPEEVGPLLDRFPESATLLSAARRRADTAEIAERRLQELSYDSAAVMWSHDLPGADLAALLLPVILTQEPEEPQELRVGYQAEMYERSSLVRRMMDQLSGPIRLDWIRHPEHGPAVRRALLSGAPLTDDELLACLPEVTRSAPTEAGETPALVEYLRLYPRLVELARPDLAEAASQLVADGWSPTGAAQAGRWGELVTVARLAESRDLIEALSRAAVHDRPTPVTVATHGAEWREPRRYELVDCLTTTTATTDKQLTYLLERLSGSHLAELQQAAGRRSRLRRLATAILAGRQAATEPAPPQQPSVPTDLPTDDELSATDDPAAALLRLWRNRGRHEQRETVAAHILASRYTTEGVAWQLPVPDLERHPVWGDRLADRIVATCGDSPARWQELTRSWGYPTQLLAATLLTRLEGVDP